MENYWASLMDISHKYGAVCLIIQGISLLLLAQETLRQRFSVFLDPSFYVFVYDFADLGCFITSVYSNPLSFVSCSVM